MRCREITDLSALRAPLRSVYGTAQGRARLEGVELVGYGRGWHVLDSSRGSADSFSQLFKTYLLCTYYVPGSILGNGETVVNNKVLEDTGFILLGSVMFTSEYGNK